MNARNTVLCSRLQVETIDTGLMEDDVHPGFSETCGSLIATEVTNRFEGRTWSTFDGMAGGVTDIADVVGETDDEGIEDVYAPERVLTDVWETAAARRVLGFVARRKLGRSLASVRIDPIPASGVGRSLRWLCLAPQDEIDDWRTSDDNAPAALGAIEEWLQGRHSSLGAAVARFFPLAAIYEEVLGCLDPRARDVLQARAGGLELQIIGNEQGVSRERIRQIEKGAIERFLGHLVALRATHHPAAAALFCHAHRIATRVLATATEEAVVLPHDDKHRWIERVLAPEEAQVLQVLLLVSEEADAELKPALDPLSTVGWSFQRGRTLSAWRDGHVQSLAAGFAHATNGQKRRWAPTPEVAARAGMDATGVSALARFANLTMHQGWIFEGRLKVADLRRAAILDFMSSAGRPLHIAEIFEGLIPLGFGADSALRDLHLAMADDPGTFVSDGTALWTSRDNVENAVEDQRPDHPDLPRPMCQEELAAALADLPPRGGRPERDLLADLSPDDGGFAAAAGRRIEAALIGLPRRERASLGQILAPADQATLAAWLRNAEPQCAADGRGEAQGSARHLEGLASLAAFVAVLRGSANSDASYWTLIYDACGQQARDWHFNSQRAAKRSTLSRFAEIASLYDLRRAFAFKSDPWTTFLGLQAGLLPGDLDSLARWLGSSQPPVALRQMVAPGPNHSPSMAAAWNVLQAYRRGHVGRDAIATLSACCEWWPGWSCADAAAACMAARTDYHSRRREGAEEPVALVPPKVATPLAALSAVIGTVLAEPQAAVAKQVEALALDMLNATLDETGTAFSVPLPSRLDVAPGAVTLMGDELRLGGAVDMGGVIRWHTDERCIKLPLRGASTRLLRIERNREVLASHALRLWGADDYLRAFTLGATGGAMFDPFERGLPRDGGVALLLHRSLLVSAEADDEHGLDGDYLLKVFRSGLAHGTTVSLDGEVFWQADLQRESRREVPDLVAHLTLEAATAAWGGTTALVFRDGLPGFIPRRACIGAQVLSAEQSGAAWRFPGYGLLPGMDSLRRRGRIEGLLDGERVSIRAVVSLANAPSRGAALRNATAWQPLAPDSGFDVARHGRSRLWICLPSPDAGQRWTVFEGPRPIAAYSQQGVRLNQHLYGYGEAIRVHPEQFNRDGHADMVALVASHTINSGAVTDCELSGDRLLLRFATPVSWGEQHRALAWSDQGFHELRGANGSEGGVAFNAPVGPISGVCVFHKAAWLGSWLLTDAPVRAVSRLLACTPTSPDVLRLALLGRLPVLAPDTIAVAAKHVEALGGKGLATLCKIVEATKDDYVAGQACEHAVGRLLETWRGGEGLAKAIVKQLADALHGGDWTMTILDRLASLAPCAVVRAGAYGLQSLPRGERRHLLQQLAHRLVLREKPEALTGAPRGRELEAAEHALLQEALRAAGLDHNFFASKAGASIASLAWGAATSLEPTRHASNLATCLTIAPVRRWLAVHLLNRFAAEAC